MEQKTGVKIIQRRINRFANKGFLQNLSLDTYGLFSFCRKSILLQNFVKVIFLLLFTNILNISYLHAQTQTLNIHVTFFRHIGESPVPVLRNVDSGLFMNKKSAISKVNQNLQNL